MHRTIPCVLCVSYIYMCIVCASYSVSLLLMAVSLSPPVCSSLLIQTNSKAPICWRIYKRIHTGSFEAIYLCMMKKTCLFLYFIIVPLSTLSLFHTLPESCSWFFLYALYSLIPLLFFTSPLLLFHLAFFSVNLMRFAFNAILSYHAKYTLSMSWESELGP